MIKTIVVVGSGVMGRGIAYVAAVGGFHVTLHVTNEAALENAQKELYKIFDKGLSRGKITGAEVEAAKNNLLFSSQLEDAARHADLVIEAVPEKAEIKRAVFESLEEYVPEHCI